MQWELPGAMARRYEGHALGLSIPARRREFCPSGDLGSSNRPFSMKAPRADVSKRGGPRLPGPRDRTSEGEPARANRCRMKRYARPTLFSVLAGCCQCQFESSPTPRHEGQPRRLRRGRSAPPSAPTTMKPRACARWRAQQSPLPRISLQFHTPGHSVPRISTVDHRLGRACRSQDIS